MWLMSTHVGTCINCLIPAANIFNIWPGVTVNHNLIIGTVRGTQAESWFVPTGVRSLRTRELSCLVSIDEGKIGNVALQ